MSDSVLQTQTLTPKQRRAAEVLVQGGSKQRAADAAGVTIRTIDRWLQDETFTAQLRAGARQLFQAAANRLAALLVVATNVIYEAMDNPQPKSSTKLRAANMALTHARAYLELSDVLERLEAVEAALGIQQ